MGRSSSAVPRLLTAEEAAALVRRLTGRRCTARQVRYLLVRGGLGSDAARGRQGQTRLLGVLDVAFLRLALTLRADGLSATVARVVLTYLRSEITLAWRSGSAVALAVTGIRGSLEPALKGRPKWATAWVPLREIWRDLDAEIQQVRQARPAIWLWRRLPAGHAAAERGRSVLS